MARLPSGLHAVVVLAVTEATLKPLAQEHADPRVIDAADLGRGPSQSLGQHRASRAAARSRCRSAEPLAPS
jgi:hypothetical protein